MSLMLLDFMDGADVGMIERRCRSRFTLEPLQREWFIYQLFRKKLKRNLAAQLQVLSLYTSPMPPPPITSSTR